MMGWSGSSFPYNKESQEDERAEFLFKNAIEAQGWPENEDIELLKRLMVNKSHGFNKPTSVELNPDAVVALLLPMLPNLKKWEIGDEGISGDGSYIWKALQRIRDSNTKSVAATHVRMIANHRYSKGSYFDYPFGNFFAFALLPNLTRISGKGIGGTLVEDSSCYSEIPKSASSVSQIELLESELGSLCLSKIIGFSKGLETFTYRSGGRCTDGGFTSLHGRELRRALEAHRSTLCRLDLECDIRLISNYAWDDYEEEEEDMSSNRDKGFIKEQKPCTAALTKTTSCRVKKKSPSKNICEVFPVFPKLTHLRISYKMLMGMVMSSSTGNEKLIDWLPPTMKELAIVGYNSNEERFRSWIGEVLKKKDEHFPNMTVVGVDEIIQHSQDLKNEKDYVEESEDDGGDAKYEDEDEKDDGNSKP